ncbi:hypothetical protein OM076_04190 [Solirubrobacter ginsenosidimutans]|uniref:Uncharacterized protein n=1 Tax=Solirubrobacter ginsenosidimutans TaxID=490573 RepID=A0A9X3MMY8_9ACTN|nr:hypothetical protein [Solirubrobacter ginsenosidimutans]MDA0159454.1 hypothetical protein [Solirubrobacter ginsenosidimutans]
MDNLIDVLLEARRLIALPGNDLSWSSFVDQESALAEIDRHIERVRAGGSDTGSMAVLFLPTGPIQEVSVSSGWGDEFLALAARFDSACCVVAGKAIHFCWLCEKEAARLTCVEGEFRRETFTGTLTQPETPSVRRAIADAAALYAHDPELAPFYCPDCRHSYCGDHWRREDVFEDDSFHDSIRGTCPEGHNRMLED